MTNSALHCRHCGALMPVSEYRCPGCRKFHRSLALPFACGGVMLLAMGLWAVLMTKVVPTFADLNAGTGRRMPTVSLWAIYFSDFARHFTELALLSFVIAVPVAGLAILPKRPGGLRWLLGGALLFLIVVLLIFVMSLHAPPFPRMAGAP